MLLYNDHDLEDLLFRTEATEPFGSYHFTCWDVKFDPAPESIIPELISLHEYFHSQLNNNTLYGTVLHIYAHLVQNIENSSYYQTILAELIRKCKGVHESYATYLSFYIANRKGAADHYVDPEAFLKNNQRYLDYFKQAKKLAPEFSQGHLNYCAVTSVLRACMQGTAIFHTLMANQLNEFVPAQQLRWRDFPESRFEQLKEIITLEFWDTVWRAMQREGKLLPGWDLIVAAEQNPELYVLTLKPEFDPAIDFIELFCYHSVRQQFIKLGLETCDYNGHIEPTKMLLEKADARLPRTKARRAMITANNAQTPVEKLTVWDFENEKFINTPRPITAIFAKLVDIPTVDWQMLFAGSQPDEHYYLVSRLPFRMLQQFQFSAEDSNYLASLPNAPLVYVQSSRVVEERIVEIFLIESPGEFEKFLHNISKSRLIVASLSMASVGNETWYRDWYDLLRQHSYSTVLMDVSPFHHFDRWLAQDEFQVKYHSINCTVEGDQVYQVFACQPQTGQLNDIFLAPCSTIVNRSLFYYIQNIINNPVRFLCDETFIIHPPNARVLPIILGHLFREEHFFDFNAGTNYRS
ncbi:hypothetical protein L0Z72_04420 [candidate division KSB1 bacterium]|nr:hypothetical protein [candidate division KSB1 bacterium]